MRGSYVGKPDAQRIKEQQAVLNKLREGGVISGAQPANPIIRGIQSLFGGAGQGAIPPLGAARLNGQEVLINRGGYSTKVAGSGPINVGGQTLYPAQRGSDLIYKRAPGLVGGEYGSFFSGAQENLSAGSPAIERAYLEEKNRAKQLADQDVLAKKYRVADLTKAYNTAQGDEKEKLGMEIFALTNPALAKKVKPGQVGYETIQATRQTNTPFGSALSAIPAVGSTNYQAAFTAPSSDIVSTAFGETTGNSLQAALGTVPELGKSGITFNPTEQEKLMGKMSISDAFTSSALGPSQENLSNLQLALLKEAFNKRFK